MTSRLIQKLGEICFNVGIVGVIVVDLTLKITLMLGMNTCY